MIILNMSLETRALSIDQTNFRPIELDKPQQNKEKYRLITKFSNNLAPFMNSDKQAVNLLTLVFDSERKLYISYSRKDTPIVFPYGNFTSLLEHHFDMLRDKYEKSNENLPVIMERGIIQSLKDVIVIPNKLKPRVNDGFRLSCVRYILKSKYTDSKRIERIRLYEFTDETYSNPIVEDWWAKRTKINPNELANPQHYAFSKRQVSKASF